MARNTLSFQRYGHKFEYFLNYWSSLKFAEDAPLWKEFDPVEIVDCLGFVNAVTVIDDGRDFEFRVYGSGLAEFYDADLTGERVSTALSPARAEKSLKFYRRVVESGKPHCLLYKIDPREIAVLDKSDKNHFWLRLAVPFTCTGQKIDRLLGYGERIDERSRCKLLAEPGQSDDQVYTVLRDAPGRSMLIGENDVFSTYHLETG